MPKIQQCAEVGVGGKREAAWKFFNPENLQTGRDPPALPGSCDGTLPRSYFLQGPGASDVNFFGT